MRRVHFHKHGEAFATSRSDSEGSGGTLSASSLSAPAARRAAPAAKALRHAAQVVGDAVKPAADGIKKGVGGSLFTLSDGFDKLSDSALEKSIAALLHKLGKVGHRVLLDPYMPQEVKNYISSGFNIVWREVEHEVLNEMLEQYGRAARKLRKSRQSKWAEPPLLVFTSHATFREKLAKVRLWARARFLYAIWPADGSMWKVIQEPLGLVINLLKLHQLTSVPMFALTFALMDRRDEFMLIAFILKFKSFQFVTAGIFPAVMMAFTSHSCIRAIAIDEPSLCIEASRASHAVFPLLMAFETVRVALLYAAFYLLLSGTAVGGQEEIQALEYVRLDLSDGKIDGMSGNETIHDQFGVDKSSKSSIRNPFGRFAPKQGRFHYGKLVQAMPATSSAIDATKEYAHRAKVHAQAHEIGLPKHNGREEEPDAPIWQPEHDVSAAELPGDKMVERSRSVTFASEEPMKDMVRSLFGLPPSSTCERAMERALREESDRAAGVNKSRAERAATRLRQWNAQSGSVISLSGEAARGRPHMMDQAAFDELQRHSKGDSKGHGRSSEAASAIQGVFRRRRRRSTGQSSGGSKEASDSAVRGHLEPKASTYYV